MNRRATITVARYGDARDRRACPKPPRALCRRTCRARGVQGRWPERARSPPAGVEVGSEPVAHRGRPPLPEAMRSLLALDYVLARLSEVMTAEQSQVWLTSPNPHLAGMRPVDVARRPRSARPRRRHRRPSKTTPRCDRLAHRPRRPDGRGEAGPFILSTCRHRRAGTGSTTPTSTRCSTRAASRPARSPRRSRRSRGGATSSWTIPEARAAC